ncbi:hypothetical protein [Variovorax sp. dw_308]|uniref:hypothetical protein n=1 Tax=Variovorax sp. dw_308 TaxID=2721546 RepID=UPI001C488983|nr:hypothetical protein [Variovorax sp. dw_308]
MPSTSFAQDVSKLFNVGQVNCMTAIGVHLDSYSYMADPSADNIYADHANARHVYARLTGDETPRMPKGGPFWTPAMLAIFYDWMQGGFQP